MYKLGVEEWPVSAVMFMYTGAKTVVRIVYGNSKYFEVKVGICQGSMLSPLLFVILLEAIFREWGQICVYHMPHIWFMPVIVPGDTEKYF